MNEEIRRVLIAARGAAAVRLCRSVREAGLESVVLLDRHDGRSRWSEQADYATHLAAGPQGWPDPGLVVSAALDAGCDAVLPGWDDLARSPRLALACEQAGLRWLGSPRELLELCADRQRVRTQAEALDLAAVPGTDALADPALALAWAVSVGFPVAVKAAGGEARPLVRVDDEEELRVVVAGMAAEGPVRVERYVLGAREIEVPIAGDGEEVVVALGTREVTGRIAGVRRVSSAPAVLDPELAAQAEDTALELAAAIMWRGVGAVQLLLTPDDRIYLLDIRPGLSPHDLVTERVYGVDLVDAALRTGLGQPLLWEPETVQPDGFALALRLQVTGDEDAAPLVARALRTPPEAALVLVEGELARPGDELGSLLVWGTARHPVLVRARIALDSLDPGGLPCALPALRRLLGDEGWWRGVLDREDTTEVAGFDPEH